MGSKCMRGGCTATYDPAQNGDTACQFHSGAPVFHDGLKGWSCCKKRVVEFAEFLTIPGCTWGRHTDVAPARPPEATPAAAAPPADSAAAASAQPVLRQVVTPPVAPAATVQDPLETPDPADAVIPDQAPCLHRGCSAKFNGPADRTSTCVYHPGQVVFHDGSKGWSCCKRKVLEFNDLFTIEGCKDGLHKFVPPPKPAVQTQVRSDWYQSGQTINVDIFVRGVQAAASRVEFGPQTLDVNLVNKDGHVHQKQFKLLHPIVPDKSQFRVTTSKVECTLHSTEPVVWSRLESDQNG